jgi:hypothetical protein
MNNIHPNRRQNGGMRAPVEMLAHLAIRLFDGENRKHSIKLIRLWQAGLKRSGMRFMPGWLDLELLVLVTSLRVFSRLRPAGSVAVQLGLRAPSELAECLALSRIIPRASTFEPASTRLHTSPTHQYANARSPSQAAFLGSCLASFWAIAKSVEQTRGEATDRQKLSGDRTTRGRAAKASRRHPKGIFAR